MKTIVNITLSIFLFANINTSIATSFSYFSLDTILSRSEVIGIFSDVEIKNIDKEKDIIKLTANNFELPLKGSVNGEIKFCSRFVDDFIYDSTISLNEYSVYLLFLYRTPTSFAGKKEFEDCDYMVIPTSQNAYPILDYSSELYSGEILIFRESGIYNDVDVKGDIYLSLNKIYMVIKLEDVLKMIKSRLHITVPQDINSENCDQK